MATVNKQKADSRRRFDRGDIVRPVHSYTEWEVKGYHVDVTGKWVYLLREVYDQEYFGTEPSTISIYVEQNNLKFVRGSFFIRAMAWARKVLGEDDG